jgi:hypothetical protein
LWNAKQLDSPDEGSTTGGLLKTLYMAIGTATIFFLLAGSSVLRTDVFSQLFQDEDNYDPWAGR